MSDDKLTPREFEILKIIARAIGAEGENRIPNNNWLAEQLHIQPNGVSNHKNRLKDKGYLENDSLTKKALNALTESRFVLPTQIPVYGQVKAGRVRQDEIVVDIQLDGSFLDTITIPPLVDTSEVFALKVVGESMEDENIFSGDHVIVQRFKESETPKQGELIVTHYLHIENEEFIDPDSLGLGEIPEEYLEGPTVKYFYKKDGKIRLSHRKDVGKSKYTIETRFYKAIGRVIGVYRDIS